MAKKKQKPLPAKQVAILEFVKEYSDKHGYPPTMREIAEGTSISGVSVVRYNLLMLERQGLVQIAANQARSIRVL